MKRRGFILGAAAAAGAFSAVRWPPGRALGAPSRTPILSGSEFQLEIGPTPINITGQPRIATAVNGQIPAPILRWREGDTVTLAVSIDPLARDPRPLADGRCARAEL